RRGETQIRETFSAVSEDGAVHLALSYRQGGMVIWATADQPNLELRAAKDPSVVRWYQEDQVMDVVRSVPLAVDQVSEIDIRFEGGRGYVWGGRERGGAFAIQRLYRRKVYVPPSPPRALPFPGKADSCPRTRLSRLRPSAQPRTPCAPFS